MPKDSPAPKAPITRAPNIQIPEDVNVLLHDFCTRHKGLNKADVARAALNRFLPDLASGKALIVNGKLVYREELTAA